MSIKNTSFSNKPSLNVHGENMDWKEPMVMGIVNITSDSFYDGGKLYQDGVLDKQSLLMQVEKMLSDGAHLIDIGGMSSRPGADILSIEVERAQLIPAIDFISKHFPNAIISADTWRSELAREAIDAGASLINDISAGTFDKAMFSTIADLKVPYIMMHMQGTPEDMQKSPQYESVTDEVFSYFQNRVKEARKCGIQQIIIDPGFGFGKSLEHNYELIKGLSRFQDLNLPILVGISRKSLICKLLNTTPAKALNGSSILHTLLLQQGANIIRTHDVKEAMEAIKILKFYDDLAI